MKNYGIKDLTSLFENKELRKDVISNRKTAFIMSANNGEIIYSEGKEAQNISKKFLKEGYDKNIKEIKGITANRGNIVAKVKILDYGYENFDKIRELVDEMVTGEILVADTTAPEIMSACKKASAIITNQGGLLSHAAIVSRELNIPCIVGLNNISELLKDGDLVEVDADNGIVRILEKNNK